MPRTQWTSPHPLDGRAIAWHGMTRLTDRRVIATDTAALRTTVGCLRRAFFALPVQLLAFAVVDTHVHALAVGARFAIGEAFRRFAIAATLARRERIGFDRCYLKPIDSQRYLESCFLYVLSQHTHHETFGDRNLEGTALHEMLGLRPSPMRSHVRRFLPRMTDATFAELLGAPPLDPRWQARLTGDEVGAIEVGGMFNAAHAALAVARPASGGAGKQPRQVLRAVVDAVDHSIPATQLAGHLGVSTSSIDRYRGRGRTPAQDGLAVARQVRLALHRRSHAED